MATQVWGSACAFLRRAGTIILAVEHRALGAAHVPARRPPPGAGAGRGARARARAQLAGRAGHAIEPAIAPLGFDWKIGVGLLASLAAREVIVATLAQIYAASRRGRPRCATRCAPTSIRARGAPVFTPRTVAALLVFFVFALQCTSTIVVMARETDSWRWPAFAFGYMLALA